MPVVIAIPAHNEERQIGACLQSLAAQTKPFDRLILLLNNCVDGTADICRTFQNSIPGLQICQERLVGHLASAGEARRLALQIATEGEADLVLMTTDADAVLEPDWVAKNVREISDGAQVVCGIAEIDPQDAIFIPPALREDDAREVLLLSINDEINSALNPDPSDPWPRHQQQSGASIALRSSVLRLAGGPPHVSKGEDRVLIERLRMVDARIRHAPDITVKVSGRLEGRAVGGMAETIKRRVIQQDVLTDEKLEPAIDALRRSRAQIRLRAVWQGRESAISFAEEILIDPARMTEISKIKFFGQAWSEIQALSPVLQRRRVAFADLSREIRVALHLRDKLVGNNEAIATKHVEAYAPSG